MTNKNQKYKKVFFINVIEKNIYTLIFLIHISESILKSNKYILQNQILKLKN